MKKRTDLATCSSSRFVLHTVTHRLFLLFFTLILAEALVLLALLYGTEGYEALLLLQQAPQILRQLVVSLTLATGGCLLLEVCLTRNEEE